MFPDLSRNDGLNRRGSNRKSLPQGDHAAVLPRSISSANLANLRLRENRHRMRFPDVVMTSLRSVFHVLSWCSRVEMIRSYAWRIIAVVQNAQAIGDWPVVSVFPCNPVGSPDARNAVPVLVKTACPNPAPLSFVDALPKPGNGSSPILSVITLARAIAISIFPRPSRKQRSASFASAWYFGSSQGVNLRNRFANWLGSFTAPTVCGPFVF